jgi:hypothetical protein
MIFIKLKRGVRLTEADFREIWLGSKGHGQREVHQNGNAPVKSYTHASRRQIRAAARTVYIQHNHPNMNEAYRLIRDLLKTDGRLASRQPIWDVLKESEFKQQRLPAGARKPRK